MTPVNDPNGKPLIYRIADALGITHLVVAVQHSHLMSEITGLIDALATKANAADVNTALAGKMDTKTIDSTPSNNADHLISSKGVKDALANKHDLVGQTISLVINGQEIEIEPVDVPNLIRALSDPDTTPTDDSENLVTSGGVAAAIGVIEINDVNFDASTLVKGIAYTMLFHNDTGDLTTLKELIDIENLPTAEKQIWFNVDSPSIEFGTGETAMLRIIRTTQGVFVWYDGTFDY